LGIVLMVCSKSTQHPPNGVPLVKYIERKGLSFATWKTSTILGEVVVITQIQPFYNNKHSPNLSAIATVCLISKNYINYNK